MGIIVGFILMLTSWAIYYYADKYSIGDLEDFNKVLAVIVMMFGILLSFISLFQKLLW